MERRLAAIVVADIVGYSRLMQEDEPGTLSAVSARWNSILAPLAARHGGRIIKFMGDGVLLEFPSAVNAVTCAVALQAEMTAANADLAPDRRLILRIGINLGDILIEGDDIFGDGVNVAARVEALADPGGICVTDTVHRQVNGKIDRPFEDLGEAVLKNMAEPVRLYRVAVPATMPTAAAAPVARPPGRTSIAVLPFDNMSGDPEQTYFSDGITEDVITELSKWKELQVIARNSSFQFRGKAVDIKDVALKLDVQFVVEGSVRKAGGRIRVTVQLIDAQSASHVWAERYDRELTDVFAIQDEISRSIAVRVAGVSQTVLAQRIRARPTSSLTAYDFYLRGRELFINYDTGMQSVPFLEKAVELDPNFAIAHALLSDTSIFAFQHSGQPASMERAQTEARIALDLDPQEPWANYAQGLVLKWKGQLREADHYFRRAIALNPNDAYILAVHASLLSLMGEHDAALQTIDEALRCDPFAYDWFWDERAMVLARAGRFQDAIDSFSRLKNPDATPPLPNCYQAICHIELGQTREAQAALERCRRAGNGRTPGEVFDREIMADPAVARRLKAALRKAEESGGTPAPG